MFCWFFRLMISCAADGRELLSGLTRRHLCNCESCRVFRRTCLSLGSDLKAQAPVSDAGTVERLNKRVIRALPHLQKKKYGAAVAIRLRPVLVAACLAMAVAIGTWAILKKPPRPDVQRTANPVAGLRRLVAEDFPLEWARTIDIPLDSELRNLTDDTESAVRFLVACMAVDPVGLHPQNK
ncbi:MAG: hypothetical protein JSU94_07730 [Phycisphaerales bacterium]|nr:MAG: hypothetical protein JSU94_07730 [Phycisphaerales bacterium]